MKKGVANISQPRGRDPRSTSGFERFFAAIVEADGPFSQEDSLADFYPAVVSPAAAFAEVAAAPACAFAGAVESVVDAAVRFAAF
jgi:hypothetical protein